VPWIASERQLMAYEHQGRRPRWPRGGTRTCLRTPGFGSCALECMGMSTALSRGFWQGRRVLLTRRAGFKWQLADEEARGSERRGGLPGRDVGGQPRLWAKL